MKPCQCNCGYRCGGPGKCSLDLFTCLAQPAGSGHFEQDCDHDWTGPVYEGESFSTVTCATCGVSKMGHDSRCGP